MQPLQTLPTAYRALVGIDMDGTLLSGNDTISSANRDAIANAITDGVAVALISGRTVCGMTKEAEALNLHTPCCGAGGAIIFEPFSGKVLKHFPLSAVERDAVLQTIGDAPLTIFCHEYDAIYIQNGKTERVDSLRRRVSCSLVDMPDLQSHYKNIPSKISLWGERDLLLSIRDQLAQSQPQLNCYMTAPDTLEISQRQAHKGWALRNIAEMLGVPQNHTIGIGDEQNDLEMLSAAAIGVAMGNANEELKNQADIIAPSNSEDGVAWVFNTVLPQLLQK